MPTRTTSSNAPADNGGGGASVPAILDDAIPAGTLLSRQFHGITTMISWEPETPTMSYLKWEETGRMLGEVDVAMKWWIADWVRWGEDRYGEKFAQALEGTQKDEKTLLTWLRVARSVAPDHRRWELTFSHHLVIAPLEPDQQSYWLQKAIDGDVLPGGGREAWSSRRLAAELKKLGQLSEAAEVEVEVEVIDKSLVPDEYLIVDIKAVREAYATSHEEIPGLRISDPAAVPAP